MARRQGRKRKQAAVAAEAANPTPKFADKGLHSETMAPYDPLSEKAVKDIIESAFELLRDVGVGFDADDDLSLDLLRDAGCDVSEPARVKIPTDLIKEAIDSVARSTKIWDRKGENYIQLDRHHTWFFSGMTCIQVADPQAPDGARPSTREDLVDIIKLVDALPNLDGACVPCKITEDATIHGEVDEFVVLAEHTSKPLEYLCEKPETLDAVIEIASAIRGGADKLTEKPYFCLLITPLPLHYAKDHSHQIINAVRAGIPIMSGTVSIGGASSPITMAGCLIHGLATDFAALVLSQLAKKGSFCMPGSDLLYMEAASGGLGGFSQQYLSDLATCQIMRSLDLPSATGLGGNSRARRFGSDSLWQVSANMTQTFYARAATVDYCGSLNEGITYSKNSLAFCNEIIGLLRKMWEGITVDEETKGMDLTRQEGPLGNYFAHPHTAQHCREEYWDARYFGANLPMESSGLPDEELTVRIENDIEKLLKNHVPEVMSPSILEAIRDIQQTFREKNPIE